MEYGALSPPGSPQVESIRIELNCRTPSCVRGLLDGVGKPTPNPPSPVHTGIWVAKSLAIEPHQVPQSGEWEFDRTVS